MRGGRVALLFAMIGFTLHSENGYDAWLRYHPLPQATAAADLQALGDSVTLLGNFEVLIAAREELSRGLRGMLGRVPRLEVAEAIPSVRLPADLPADGFRIKTVRQGSAHYTLVAGGTPHGVLYGVFALLRSIALAQPIGALDVTEVPYAPIRWVNQWDNLDGSIERGYGGRSIFWENGHVRADLSRVSDYGRLLASIGINGCSINNVNADPRVLNQEMLPEVARIAAAFRPWGVRVAISADFSSPKTVGGLDTFDPLNPRVAAWWSAKVDELYRAVPDLAGIIIKADSEGRPGPSAYGRTHADAANVVARALKPHGGLLFYRAFVYDHHLDWRNPKNDRARAADDNFRPLDGKFDPNVVLQIKNGPIDFQVREPDSPLFGNLEKTNQAIELQITQEYLGQARHTVFLAPMWKEVLDFNMRAKPATSTPVKALVAGRVFGRPLGGFVGVSNAGLSDNWFANHLSQANLYAFGRLAWNPDLSAREVSEEWTRLTFGSDPAVDSVVNEIQLSSWRTYENYTGPLGLQTLTDITGNHYGVNVEASERNGWGQWHRADAQGVGMDRSVRTGTGFAGQYRPEVAKMYESPAGTPDDLLLFFHHVPYTYRLHSGKTVIESLYDSHYEGAEAVSNYVRMWRKLEGLIDERRYQEVLAQLEYQAGQAEVWRDAVVSWFLKESGIPDEKGRAGNHPGRVEAESMQLQRYTQISVTPWEAASAGMAVSCPISQCSARFVFEGSPGRHEIRIRYFDQNNGVARFRLFLNGQLLDQWAAADHLPTQKIDGTSSSLRIVPGVALKPGDEIRVEGSPDGGDSAALDYIEIQ
ncbi:MAG TPA: alpha-glucuronidase family glycosyl hydrolase [Bryobacteraceae bacterium]|nr:alpha-glucuronidase family glycosyl hydrolase [Bryobacteraceae bacterium]